MESSGTSAETLKGEISSFSSEVSGGISFRCIVGGKMGSASTELLCDEEMKALVERAIENAKNIESDDKAVIFAGSEKYAELTLPEFPAKDTAELKKLALDLHNKITAESEYIIDGTSAMVIQNSTRIVLINSHGLELSTDVGVVGMAAEAVVSKDGENQAAFALESGFGEELVGNLAKKATADALAKIGAGEIESGKYDVIFCGKQMKDILSAFSSVFSGRSANLGLSLLKGKEGEKIAADCVTLIDDPQKKGSATQTAFDGEGVATYTKNPDTQKREHNTLSLYIRRIILACCMHNTYIFETPSLHVLCTMQAHQDYHVASISIVAQGYSVYMRALRTY